MIRTLVHLHAAVAFLLYLPTAAHSQAGVPFQGLSLDHLQTNAQDPDVIYAGTERAWSSSDGRVFRSSDAGETWQALNILGPENPQPIPLALAISPGNPSVLYMGTLLTTGSVWKSLDQGRTWTQASAGLPVTAGNSVFELLVSNQPGSPLYALVGRRNVTNSLYQTANGGATWTLVKDLPNGFLRLALAPSEPNLLYYGLGEKVFHSSNGGSTWVELGTVPGNVFHLVVSSANPMHLYAGGSTGVFRSRNGGVTWENILNVPVARIQVLAPSDIYVLEGTRTAIQASADDGKTWRKLSSPIGAFLWSFARHPTKKNVIHGAASNGYVRYLEGSGAYRGTIRPTLWLPVREFAFSIAAGLNLDGGFAFPVGAREFPFPFLPPFNSRVDGAPWLTAGPSSRNRVFASMRIGNLSPGRHTGMIRIAADWAVNAEVTADVSVQVESPLPGEARFELVAGSGARATRISSDHGDGGPPEKARLDTPGHMVFDSSGNLFWTEVGDPHVVEIGRHVIRKLTPEGRISTFAGAGEPGYIGDGPALRAKLLRPGAIAFTKKGELVFADQGNEVVRLIDADGMIRTVVGNPNGALPQAPIRWGENIRSRKLFVRALSKAISRDGFYLFDGIWRQLVRVTSDGLAYPVAGGGSINADGENIQATAVALGEINSISVSPVGEILLSEEFRIRKVSLEGRISTIAGSGLPGWPQNLQQAITARISPRALVAGPFYGGPNAVDTVALFMDEESRTVQRIDRSGKLTRVAGNGLFVGLFSSSENFHGASVRHVPFYGLGSLAVNQAGVVYISDNFARRIYRFSLDPSAPGSGGGDPPATAIRGEMVPELAAFDGLMETLIGKHGIPGGALAIVRNGRLVFARGYGWADLDGHRLVQPNSLFRISNLSTSLTGVALAKLAEEGRINLDARAFDVLEREYISSTGPRDSRLREITIRQLLNHSGGWDQPEPMFQLAQAARSVGAPEPASCDTVIRYMVSQPLHFPPGSRFANSLFGYCVLGRIVEKITGSSYESWVRANILAPMGITGMQIGSSFAAKRAPGEVTYYEIDFPFFASIFPGLPGIVPAPYGTFHLEALDSSEGWIGSAVDLVRFLSGIDGRTGTPALGPAGLRMFTQRPPPPLWAETPHWYASGLWVHDNGTWWNGGSLPGSITYMARMGDGHAFAALFNSRPFDPSLFFKDIADGFSERRHQITNWPAHDLFPRFYPLARPSISATNGVVHGATFEPAIVPGSWVSIRGTALAEATRTWRAEEIVSNRLPTQLEGVTVQVNGKDAFVYYVSPTQVNVLAPEEETTSEVEVVLSRRGTASNTVRSQLRRHLPGWFTYSSGGERHVVAVQVDGTVVGNPAAVPGTRPCKPGDRIQAYGTGFEPAPSGQVISQPIPLASPAIVYFGATRAEIEFAGLVGAGLFQCNILVPDVPTGDHELIVEVNGARSPAGVFIRVEK